MGESEVIDEAGPGVPAARRRRSLPLRRIAAVVLAILALPLVLAPVYRWLPPPSTLMLADLATSGGYRRDWVRIDDIAPAMVEAVIAGEDGRFCSHAGVDWDALGDVLSTDGGPSRGASTITMQTVKNVFLWPGRSYLRKALEIPLALYVDLVWGKRRTMEIYLNIVELGDGLYGVGAAAELYFGKPASALSRRQAALIASALPNPAARNPAHPTRIQRAYARVIEARMQGIAPFAACVGG